MVYTAAASAHPGWDSYSDWMREPYEVRDVSGRVLRKVDGNGSTRDGEPTRIALPPGDYLVRGPGVLKARAVLHGDTILEVPVRIEAGRLTVVHLDGSPAEPNPGDGR